ncbi:T9SS sorting signal type C domain-containing protein [Flavobacterium myungsuense]|uniref:T9SS sorting signal type C domain-containing protein n=1 Tax=Flavobacterium myungsuense TaxID=651823 RepID=A0ABW3J2D7_9FLAO
MKNLMIQIENKFSAKGLLKLIFVVLIFLISCYKGLGQVINSTTYPVTNTSGQSINSYTSLGTLLSTGSDDGNSSLTNIGFNFWFNGVTYSQFGVNANGHLKLGSVITGNRFNNNLADGVEDPKIAPFWDDLTTGSNGYVRYGLNGIAPNRSLVIEWKTNLYVNSSSVSQNAPMVFQAILSENTGRIQFIYSGTIASGGTYSIGFSSSGSSIVSIASATNSATYGSDPNNTQSTAIVAGRSYSFTPTSMGVPTTAINASTQTICSTATATLSGNTPVIGIGSWSVVSGPNTLTSQFSNVSNPNAIFTPAGGAGSYVIRWTISNSSFTPSTADATITVNAEAFTQVGSTNTFCIDNQNTITTASVNSGQFVVVDIIRGFNYTFSVGNVFATNENLTVLDAISNDNLTPSLSASGASGASITWTATFSGQVKIRLTSGNCSNLAGGALTLRINSIGNTQDSQTAFGTDQWIGHIYNWTGSAPPGGTSPNTPTNSVPFDNANYVGYYNVPTETFVEGFGGNYACFPVLSNGAIRTNIYTEQYAVRYRMRSTKTGCYLINFNGDDGIRIYVDGVKVFDAWIVQAPTVYQNVLVNLSGSSEIVFDFFENFIQNECNFTITPFVPSANTISSTSTSVCSGIVPSLIDGSPFVYNGSTANPSMSFQWQLSTDGINFTNISGATSEDYTPVAQTTTVNTNRFFRRALIGSTQGPNSCLSYSNIFTLVTTVTPTVATNTSTQTICATGTAILSGNSPIVGTGLWSVVSGPSTIVSQFSNASSPTAQFTPAGGAGSYVIRWTISNSPCTASIANATITVTAAPTTATNTSTRTICVSGTATLAGNTPTVGTGSWNVVSGPSVLVSQFSNASSPTAIFTPAGGAGAYVVRWTISSGSCSTSANATVTVSGAPNVATNTSTQTICATGTAILSGNSPIVGTGLWSVVSGPSTIVSQFSNASSPTAQFTPAGGAGSYVIRWTISNSLCTASIANATITVTAAPTTATNTSTQTICATATALLSGNTPTVGTGSWNVVSGPSVLVSQFSNASSPTAVFTPAGGAGVYVVRWTISNTTCSTSANATITVISGTAAGTVIGGSTICSGSTSGLLTLSGHTGTVIRWESSVSPFSTWIPIVNTATTYTSGNITQETRFRAVVQNNSCSILNAAFTTVTLGNTSTWNGSSWSNGIPLSSTVAIIAGNYVSAINGGDINACSLTINSGDVVISSGNTVSLFGALNVISGSFTLENNANLLQSTDVSNSGNIIVKRNTAPLMRLDYILWSSPVANQKLLAFSPNTLVNRFYTYDASTDKYAPVASPSTTNFEPGIGYLIRVSNTHPTTPTIFGGQFTGVANNGTVNLPVTNATYNAIGNPYPSTINANAFIAQNGITEALYFWRKTNNSNNSSYATYTTAGGVCNLGGDSLALTPNGIIAVGSGFIVKATSTNITCNNAMRVSNSNAPFLRTFDERNRIWLNLSSVSGAFYQTMVAYMPNATSNVDAAIDGRFLNDTPNALTSLIDGQEYTIQGRALPFDGSDTVLLGFKAKTAENYTITLSNFDGLFSSNQSVFIKDNNSNTIHDLKSGPYTFASEAGTFNTRFEIVYQNNSLSTQTPSFNEKSIVVYKQNQEVVVNSGSVQMSNVAIYDIRGRLLIAKDKINASEVKLYTGTTKQVLIVKITSDTNEIVTKKIIN